MLNLPKLQSIIAPLATPAAPAVLLANEVYRTMIDVDIQSIIALVSAIIAIVGIEFSGALMCHNAVKAWQRRSTQLMTVAIIGALIYAIIVIAAIATMPEARGRVFGVMVLLTLVAYAGYAIYTSFEADDSRTMADNQAQIDLLDKQRLLTNAQTRQIKAGGPVSNVQLDKNGQIEQPAEQRITPAGQRIIEYLEANGPNASLRDIAQAVNVKSPSTVAQWIDYWKANKVGNPGSQMEK